MLALPKVYAITDRTISGLSHAEQVRQLIDGGIQLIQLREKLLAPRDWIEDASLAARIARDSDVTLIVNDRVDIAMAVDADGVHLGQTDMPVEAARRLLGPQKLIGLSTHSIEQVVFALSQPVDHIAFGPVFTTTTKVDPDAVTGIELLAEVRSIVGDMPLIAIGGIDHLNAGDVMSAGADSVAVISCLLNRNLSISAASRELMAVAAHKH